MLCLVGCVVFVGIVDLCCLLLFYTSDAMCSVSYIVCWMVFVLFYACSRLRFIRCRLLCCVGHSAMCAYVMYDGECMFDMVLCRCLSCVGCGLYGDAGGVVFCVVFYVFD